MKDFFAFLKSKPFFIHSGIALLLLVITVWVLIKSLNSYTDHGVTVTVPDFTGKSILELKAFVEGKGVNYEITDSIYDPKLKPGSVIRQDPEANSQVKHNRTVYLYVTGMQPPKIIMPKLIDRSVRQAVLMIQSYGLKAGNVIVVPADCDGCVIEQLVKGKPVESGALISKGTKIDLTVGKKERGVSSSNNTESSDKEINFEEKQ